MARYHQLSRTSPRKVSKTPSEARSPLTSDTREPGLQLRNLRLCQFVEQRFDPGNWLPLSYVEERCGRTVRPARAMLCIANAESTQLASEGMMLQASVAQSRTRFRAERVATAA